MLTANHGDDWLWRDSAGFDEKQDNGKHRPKKHKTASAQAKGYSEPQLFTKTPAPWRESGYDPRKQKQGKSDETHSFQHDWGYLLGHDDVLILSVNTSGQASDAEVIEIAAIDTSERELLHRYSLPEISITSSATKLHGLDIGSLEQHEAEPWTDIHQDVCALLKAAFSVVIYDADFTIRIFLQTAEKYNLPVPNFSYRCAMREYASYRNSRKARLADVARHENITIERNHDALGDCYMVIALMANVAKQTEEFENMLQWRTKQTDIQAGS